MSGKVHQDVETLVREKTVSHSTTVMRHSFRIMDGAMRQGMGETVLDSTLMVMLLPVKQELRKKIHK